MNQYVILLSIPGLREQDLARMPRLRQLTAPGDQATLVPSFPALTCPVQANMTTGHRPSQHGVVGNGFYYRDKRQVEMWTAWNDCIESPQIWDLLREHDPDLTSAVWFAMHSKGCEADYVCTPAPIHNPDGSESLWCYTRPIELYGELRDELGHFPLQHFWGPLANVKSTAWIADSAILAARQFRPNFSYIYLTHLDYAAQKLGPDSPQAAAAVVELDEVLGRLIDGYAQANGDDGLLWIVASEYAIVPVDHVVYPNRLLREAGLLTVCDEVVSEQAADQETSGGELIDLENSSAWVLADHQLGHVFVGHDGKADAALIERVADLFRSVGGIAEVLVGEERARYDLDHPRSGEIVLVSAPNSWQAYYYWLDDAKAPSFARTVDIHRKVGYDPVEMHFDPATRGIPLDATLIGGSHGAPATDSQQWGVLLSSQQGVFSQQRLRDTDVAQIVLRQFGI